MIKLLKWIYEMGREKGWDDAVEASRKGHTLMTSKEGEQLRLDDEAIMEILKQEAEHEA